MSFELEPLLANSRAYWLGWGVEDRDDCLFRSGIGDAQLNGVVRRDGRPFAVQLAEARERLAGVPWLWWAEPGAPEPAGGTRAYGMPVMAVELGGVHQSAVGVELEIGPVDDLREWVAVYAPSLGVEPAQVDAVTAVEASMPGRMTRFAGRVDGRIVGTSALLETEGAAGVYAVTVAPGFRGRGIGTAMTAAALRAGRDNGSRIGTLQATGEGKPVYERMGFETVGRYELYGF